MTLECLRRSFYYLNIAIGRPENSAIELNANVPMSENRVFNCLHQINGQKTTNTSSTHCTSKNAQESTAAALLHPLPPSFSHSHCLAFFLELSL